MLSWEYPPHVVGGLGQHVADLVPALAELGVEVHLVTPDWRRQAGAVPEDATCGCPSPIPGGESAGQSVGTHLPAAAFVHRVPVERTQRDIATEAIAVNEQLTAAGQELATKYTFDLIHAHDWLVSFAAISLKHRFRLPLLATIHATEYGRSQGNMANPLSQRIHQAEWALAYEAWRVITCSNFMAREVISALDVPPDKVDVIPNGVDAARFAALKGRDYTAVRSRYALPWERIVFNVGRMVREKGVHILVEAMPLVLAQVPEAKFVVGGRPDPWGYWEAARRRAADLGVGAKAYFTGFLPEEERDVLFLLADVAVFPSLYEPFGIVALQAMAAGAPVVASGAGGLAEVVIHELTGLTAYPGDPQSLAWAIVRTLKCPDKAQARARAAYQRVVQEYNWPRIANSTLAVYKRIVQERASVDW